MLTHRALPVGYRVTSSFFLVLLVSVFPAICDLWQKKPNSFDILIVPKSGLNSAQCHDWRKRNLVIRDVTIQTRVADSKLLCSFTAGVFAHCGNGITR